MLPDILDSDNDIEVIGSLYKTEVYELARHLKLPSNFIKKKPSAELFHGHTDEEELGGSYKVIDEILGKVTKGKNVKGQLAEKILKRIKENRHKTRAIPVIK